MRLAQIYDTALRPPQPSLLSCRILVVPARLLSDTDAVEPDSPRQDIPSYFGGRPLSYRGLGLYVGKDLPLVNQSRDKVLLGVPRRPLPTPPPDQQIPACKVIRLPDVPAASWSSVISELHLEDIARITPSHLAFLIALMVAPLMSVEPHRGVVAAYQEAAQRQATPDFPEPTVRAFAEQVAFARVIPFGQLPLDQESLAMLVTTASDTGDSAKAGLVTYQSVPLLSIAHPEAVVIAGSKPEVDLALQKGLWSRFEHLLSKAASRPPES